MFFSKALRDELMDGCRVMGLHILFTFQWCGGGNNRLIGQ
jgi:hypothetical protein